MIASIYLYTDQVYINLKMENNNIETYEKIAEIITKINNLSNFRKARLKFNRISQNSNPVFSFISSKKQNPKDIKKNEIIITKLPFIEKLNEFFWSKLHESSPKNDCKAKLCECNIKFDEDRKFVLMWKLVYYFYFPEYIDDWEDLNPEHLKDVLSYNFSEVSEYKTLLIQQIRSLFTEIRDQFPDHTLLDKNGLNKCIIKEKHDTELLEVIWESESQIEVSNHINQNIYRPLLTLEQKRERFPKYKIDKVRCKNCYTVYYILMEAVLVEKKNDIWDKIYSTFSQDTSIRYKGKTRNLYNENWRALSELFEIHGLTKNQAEVAAKLNFEIPLKDSTLRNTKKQLKKKLGNIEKILEVWDDLKWI